VLPWLIGAAVGPAVGAGARAGELRAGSIHNALLEIIFLWWCSSALRLVIGLAC